MAAYPRSVPKGKIDMLYLRMSIVTVYSPTGTEEIENEQPGKGEDHQISGIGLEPLLKGRDASTWVRHDIDTPDGHCAGRITDCAEYSGGGLAANESTSRVGMKL